MTANSKPILAAGIDLGGTNYKVALVTLAGRVLDRTDAPTLNERGADDVVLRIGGTVRELLARNQLVPEDLAGIGIGSPGPLSTRTGRIIETPNLGWRDYPLRDRIKEQFDRPTFLDNDANVAAYGEWWVGAGRGAGSLVCFTLGTGVGGGIILNHDVWRGPDDTGAELGHMTIRAEGELCGCGNHGCLEAYASATGIVRTAQRLLAERPDAVTTLRDLDKAGKLTSKDIADWAAKGDALAAESWDRSARDLGVGIASMINILNPEVVVLSGGVIAAGDLLFAPVRDEVARRAFKTPVERARIIPAELGGDAGSVGAAGVLFRELGLIQ